MRHASGDPSAQHLYQRRGLSQTKQTVGIGQDASIVSEMCRGQRLYEETARRRVVAWLQRKGISATLEEVDVMQ
jgi:beta-lactamase superfamily II metal-dependent hydrolase